MFEGKPPRPRDARPLDDEQRDIDALRPLIWGELVARFTAARDLRSACEAADGSGEASFDAGSARRIAAHHSGKQDVNLDVSGNGKSHARTAPRAAVGAELRAMRK
jgi:hypothetical protein